MRNSLTFVLAAGVTGLAAACVGRCDATTLISPGTNTQTSSGAVVAGNGNFDQVPLSSGQYVGSIPGWSSTGGIFQHGNAYSAPNYFAQNANSTGSITSVPAGAQIPYSYSTAAGDVFTLSYWAADNNGNATGSLLNVTAELIFGSDTETVIPTTDFTSAAYTEATGTYVATAADAGLTPIVKLLAVNNSNQFNSNSQLQIDSVGLSVAPVPEPASLGLVALGATGLVLLLKKRARPTS